MKITHKLEIGMIVWVLSLSTTSLCYADESVAGQIGHKFIRGVANIVTGWLEIPKLVYLRTAGGPPVIGSVQGVVEGIGMSFARTTAGLYDIATFPVPLPIHYEPLFEPEYVWQDENKDQVN